MKQEKILRVTVIGLVLLTVILMVSGLVGAAKGDLPTGSAGTSSFSVGYVDMDTLQKTLPDFIDLQNYTGQMYQELADFNKYLSTQAKNSLQALDNEQTKAKQGKTADEQKNIDDQYTKLKQDKYNEFQKQADQKRSELGAKVNEQTQATMAKVKKIIEQVAKNENIGLVMDERALFFGGVDLTKKVQDIAAKASTTTTTTTTTK